MSTNILNDRQIREINKYVNAMRNGTKKVYADYYLAWKLHPEDNKEPSDMGLSYMGAQAVRMVINKILES